MITNALKDKVTVVTGASHGFGFAVAQEFLKQGAKVAICGRDILALEQARKNLLAMNPHSEIFAMSVDIASPQAVTQFVEAIRQNLGLIDVLVANAGIYGTKGPVDKIDWDEWSYAIDVNLKGTAFCCRAVLADMKSKKSGKIIVLSGGGATKPLPTLSSYAAAKAGIVRFAETLAEEVRNDHIDVNSIAPGALNTRLLDELLDVDKDLLDKDFYLRSLKQKEEGGDSIEQGVALCVYLASSASNGITGKLISAKWDPWREFNRNKNDFEKLMHSDIYTLRRIVPEDRGIKS